MLKKLITAAFFAALTGTSVQAQECLLKDARVCVVYSKAQSVKPLRQIVWREFSTSNPSIAAEYEWALGPADVIHLGDTKYIGDDALFFLVAHELGHSVNGHGRKLLEAIASEQDRELADADLVKKYAQSLNDFDERINVVSRQQELEADQFAVELMLKQGMDPVKAMKALLKNRASNASYPSRNQRIQHAEKIAAAYAATKFARMQ